MHVKLIHHIRHRPLSCQVSGTPPVAEGLGEGHIAELEAQVATWDREPGLSLSDGSKYLALCRIVFPDMTLHDLLAFGTGVGENPHVRKVQAVRDYWAAHGERVVGGVFWGKTEEEMEALQAVVLDRILSRVLMGE